MRLRAPGRRRRPPPRSRSCSRAIRACPRPSSRRRCSASSGAAWRSRSSRCATRPIRPVHALHRADRGAGALSAGVPVPGAARACCAPGGGCGAGRPIATARAPVAARSAARSARANRVRRFGQALVLAAELPADIGLAATPISCTRRLRSRAMPPSLRGLPWCVSAHAKDIWTTPAWEQREKLADCAWATTCTPHAPRICARWRPAAEVMLAYHGLDSARFPAPAPAAAARTAAMRPTGAAARRRAPGAEEGHRGAARRRWRRCRPTLHWRYEHIGGGPLRDALKAQAARLGIAERITWRGALAAGRRCCDAYRARRSVRAGEPDRAGRRPRRPAQRAAGGGRAWSCAVVASRVGARCPS